MVPAGFEVPSQQLTDAAEEVQRCSVALEDAKAAKIELVRAEIGMSVDEPPGDSMAFKGDEFDLAQWVLSCRPLDEGGTQSFISHLKQQLTACCDADGSLDYSNLAAASADTRTTPLFVSCVPGEY